MRRWLLPIALLAPAAILVAGSSVADRLALAAVDRLLPLARVLTQRAAAPEPEPDAELTPTSSPTVAPSAKEKPGARRAGAPPTSVFVSAARVLALAESGARPRGTPVAATAKRPAGLRLSGVGALGLGLADGDVLTEAAGAPALSSGAVVEGVLRARARQAKTISGTCYRGDERFAVVVEQPYFPRRADVDQEAPRLALTLGADGRRLSRP
jgi:hypothetical protein